MKQFVSGGVGHKVFHHFHSSKSLNYKFSPQSNTYTTARPQFHLTSPTAACWSCITAFSLLIHIFICMFVDLYMCVFVIVHASAYIVTVFLSLMSTSQGTTGAHPLYLFVRQPDECNWQSYYNFTKAVFFTAGACMRGIVDSCRREDNWVN